MAVKKADVILLLYHCRPDESKDVSAGIVRKKLRHWLQRVRLLREGNSPPVILVGTHSDTRASSIPSEDASEDEMVRFYESIENLNYQEQMQPIFSEYPEVEGGYEVSCTLLINLQAALVNAHKAVMFPMAPIYDAENKRLTPLFLDRLKRIFTLCDADGDGALCDKEIMYFNHRTFGLELPDKDLQHVKKVAQYSNPNYIDANGFVKFEGFCFWITVFAEKQEEEVPWQVLYEWGYDRKLNLDEKFLFPKDIYNFDGEISAEDLLAPDPCVAQLSASGLNFLRDLFNRWKNPESGLMTVGMVGTLFNMLSLNQKPQITCPFDLDAVSRGAIVPVDPVRGLDLDSFVGLWLSLLQNTPESVKQVVRCATYLGFTNEAEDGDRLVPDPLIKWIYQPERTQRTFFHVMIVSHSALVAQELCSMLSRVGAQPGPICVGRAYHPDGIKQGQNQGALGWVRYHVVSSSNSLEELLTLERASHLDCLVLGFDDTMESVQCITNAINLVSSSTPLRSNVPILFAHVPAREEKNNNQAKVASFQLCRSLGLPLPLSLVAREDWEHFLDRFFRCVLLNPTEHRMVVRSTTVKVMIGALIVAALCGAGYFAYTKMQNKNE